MSSKLKVLFVCAMNKQRSVTAERLYKNDARLEVRSAGVRAGACRRVSEADLHWADIVFVMEQEHKLWITTRFQELHLPKIEVLNIPDEFEVMDPGLQQLLKLMLDAEFDHLTRIQEDD
ncbi:MAG: phosphotyrosine protein phosphatase [Verrucomicrobiales bacterium]|jgi:protein-tyrosine phosphatase|nr:phosphotyrosine protein phosphatase [Verrucomicrobiales bacterium]